MTGFGRGLAEGNGYAVQADLRTLNHRFCEVRVRGLAELPGLAHRCEQQLRAAFARGSLELAVRWQASGEARPRQVNMTAALRYAQELSHLKDQLGVPQGPSLSHLIQLGVFEEVAPDERALWPALEAALVQAVEGARRAREVEGVSLHQALAREAQALAELVQAGRGQAADALAEAERRLRARIAELEVELDPGRLETELVVWGERADVSEELDRLAAHCRRVNELLAAAGPVGRELEFVAQEVGREAGTLAAKARSSPLAQTALAMRMAAERMREQARNAE
ncbi:MAG: YicC family protein [Candidatus Bipolaricaulaceae bacterium]